MLSIAKTGLFWPYLLTSPMVISPQKATQLSYESIFKSTKNSIVFIESKAPNGSLSQGSGVVLYNNIVATNKHVLENGNEITISQGNKYWHVQEIAISNSIDVAFLKIKDLDLPQILKHSPCHPAIGSKIFTLGNPKGFEATFTDGIISGIRNINNTSYYQISAPISPGSSGGALLDQTGKLLGITTFKIRGGENLNFAISIDNIIAEFKNSNFISIYSVKHTNANTDMDIIIQKAKNALVNENPEIAISLLKPLYKQYPENSIIKQIIANALTMKCITSFNAAFLDEALAFAKAAIEIDETNYLTWNLIGRIYYRQLRYRDAIPPFQRAISINQKDKQSIYLLGWCYVALRKSDNARQCYRDLIHIDNNLAEDLWNKGIWPLIRP